MATKRTSQPQQSAPTNPFAQLPGMEMWQSMMDAQRERLEQLATEYQRMETERHARTLTAIDEMAKLVKSSIEYNQQLTAQMRDLTLEAARKTAGLAGANN